MDKAVEELIKKYALSFAKKYVKYLSDKMDDFQKNPLTVLEKEDFQEFSDNMTDLTKYARRKLGFLNTNVKLFVKALGCSAKLKDIQNGEFVKRDMKEFTEEIDELLKALSQLQSVIYPFREDNDIKIADISLKSVFFELLFDKKKIFKYFKSR